MDKIWLNLYKEAKNKLQTREVSPFIESGTYSCALLTKNNKIFTGISVLSNTGLNITAEKSAIISMLNNNEKNITKMVILNELEETITPSIECFTYLSELSDIEDDIEVLVNINKGIVKKVSELLPNWWGTFRNIKE